MPKPRKKSTEVVAAPENDRRQRRRFSADEKERILAEADACERGELGELLRREGIYSSHLVNWRAQRDAHGRAGLEPQKPGPKATRDERDRKIEKQARTIAMLEKELRIAKGLIDLQVKAHEILGIALPRIDDANEDDSSSSSNSAQKRSR